MNSLLPHPGNRRQPRSFLNRPFRPARSRVDRSDGLDSGPDVLLYTGRPQSRSAHNVDFEKVLRLFDRTVPITAFSLGALIQCTAMGEPPTRWTDTPAQHSLRHIKDAQGRPNRDIRVSRDRPHRLPEITNGPTRLVSHDQTSMLAPEPGAAVDLEPLPTPEAERLSLDQFEQIALANNPVLARARARISALRGRWIQVGLPPNPTVGYLGEEMGDGGTAGLQGGFVGQRLITAGKLGLNRAVVSREISRARQEMNEQFQRVVTDVRIAYYDVLVAQRQVELTEKLVKASEETVHTSEALLAAREVSRVALLQTEVQAQDARILNRRAENELAASWRRLTSVLGMPEMEYQPLAGPLASTKDELDWNETLDRLQAESPEMATAVAELERAQWALRRATVEAKPDVDIQLAVHHSDPTDSTVAGVLLGLPLPVLNRNQGGIRQARSQIVAAERNIERVELDLRQRLANAFNEYASARFETQQYTQEILPKAQETFDLVTRAYRENEVGYLDLLAAQRTYFQTNLSYLLAVRELQRSRLRIEGLLLDGSLREVPHQTRSVTFTPLYR